MQKISLIECHLIHKALISESTVYKPFPCFFLVPKQRFGIPFLVSKQSLDRNEKITQLFIKQLAKVSHYLFFNESLDSFCTSVANT